MQDRRKEKFSHPRGLGGKGVGQCTDPVTESSVNGRIFLIVNGYWLSSADSIKPEPGLKWVAGRLPIARARITAVWDDPEEEESCPKWSCYYFTRRHEGTKILTKYFNRQRKPACLTEMSEWAKNRTNCYDPRPGGKIPLASISLHV